MFKDLPEKEIQEQKKRVARTIETTGFKVKEVSDEALTEMVRFLNDELREPKIENLNLPKEGEYPEIGDWLITTTKRTLATQERNKKYAELRKASRQRGEE